MFKVETELMVFVIFSLMVFAVRVFPVLDMGLGKYIQLKKKKKKKTVGIEPRTS